MDLLFETSQTLELLFPPFDRNLRKWYRDIAPSRFLDMGLLTPSYIRTDVRHIENFRVWRERIVILKLFFDDCEPTTFWQLWYDRRNGERWFGGLNALAILTLTVVTIFLGIVQCIESGAQIGKKS